MGIAARVPPQYGAGLVGQMPRKGLGQLHIAIVDELLDLRVAERAPEVAGIGHKTLSFAKICGLIQLPLAAEQAGKR